MGPRGTTEAGTAGLLPNHIEMTDQIPWRILSGGPDYGPIIRFDRNNQKSLRNRTLSVDEEEDHSAARSWRLLSVSPAAGRKVFGRERGLRCGAEADQEALSLVRAQFERWPVSHWKEIQKMKAYQKWVFSLGIAAVTPGITLAGPFSIFNRSTQATRPAAAVDNQKLAEAVAQKLRAAKLAGFDIEIEVQEGVCQLMGRIKDAEQKERASAVASQVPGIRRIDNRLELIKGQPVAAVRQPLPVARSRSGPSPSPDRKIQAPQPQRRVNLAGFFSRNSASAAAGNEQQIANQIAGAIGQSGVRGHSIDLKYKQGVAMLSGACRSRRDVARITEVVSLVPGVRQVDNRLQVAGPASAPFMSMPAGSAARQGPADLPAGGNQAVAEQIAQALAANHLGGLDIEVRYNSGVCTLGGAVKHPQQAAWAAHVAQQVPGVNSIDNKLALAAASPIRPASFQQPGQPAGFQGGPQMVTPPMPSPAMKGHGGAGSSHLAYDLPNLPNYAWPSYASYPNAAQISYPTEYSASAWPYIGPFYPYPQVPMGWRDVRLSWDDGHWSLAFNSRTDKWFWFLDPKNW